MGINEKKIDFLLDCLKQYSLETYEHSKRVGELCASFGKFLGLDEEDIEKIKICGLLHDIGKMKIPITLLHKTSKYTEEEYEFIKKHPGYGVEILIEMGIIDEDILDLVLSHHERVDGLGYPNGKKDDEISFLSKILAICDCYDAMNSVRSYRGKLPNENIISELILNSGTQFDSKLVDSFLQYLNQDLYKEEKLKKVNKC